MPLPPRQILSKSTFMYGCQCTKRLWLHKYQPEVRDEETEEQTAIFQSGTNVGMLTRQLFPYGVDASPPTYYQYQLSLADIIPNNWFYTDYIVNILQNHRGIL